MIRIKAKGTYKNANKYLHKLLEIVKLDSLNKYGKMGVEALSAATPSNSGKTASSWVYEIAHSDDGAKIVWSNTNTNDGVNIAIILQYGHGTGTGGYVEGRDYINPAIQPIFDKIANSASEEVKHI